MKGRHKNNWEEYQAIYYGKVTEGTRALAENPRPHGYKKLKGRNGYRIRIADYRVIYTIQDHLLTIYVINIDNRKDVYR